MIKEKVNNDIHTVVIFTQHAEPWKDVRSKEVAWYTRPKDGIKHGIHVQFHCQPALTERGDRAHLYIQPSGKFIIGDAQTRKQR